MTALVFVDTNVLLYARDRRFPVKQRHAAEWMAHLWREMAGRTSMQVLAEFYVNATKIKAGLTPDEAWDEVTMFLDWNPQATDAAVFEMAHEVERRYRLSWWDSTIVAAARLQGCEILLTEDLQDGLRLGSLQVRSPFTLGVSEAVARYAAGPRARPVHRGRGRPARAAA